LVFAELLGSTATGAIDISGGNGGAGGNGTGLGTGGNGGGAASSGILNMFNLATGVVTTSSQVSAAVSWTGASGATGGAGAIATVTQINL
jgi:hypothetical protein